MERSRKSTDKTKSEYFWALKKPKFFDHIGIGNTIMNIIRVVFRIIKDRVIGSPF
jgi:hypothetical protein